MLLGSDFQGQHKRVIFEYHGSKPNFVVNNLTDICSSMISNVSPINLFKNLLGGCRPIATKSRRFNTDDRSFIQEEIDKLKKVGGNCQEDHDENVSQFLQSIRRRGLLFNQSETILSVLCINILGYSVGNGITKPDPERLKPLLELLGQHNAKSLKRALGMLAC